MQCRGEKSLEAKHSPSNLKIVVSDYNERQANNVVNMPAITNHNIPRFDYLAVLNLDNHDADREDHSRISSELHLLPPQSSSDDFGEERGLDAAHVDILTCLLKLDALD